MPVLKDIKVKLASAGSVSGFLIAPDLIFLLLKKKMASRLAINPPRGFCRSSWILQTEGVGLSFSFPVVP